MVCVDVKWCVCGVWCIEEEGGGEEIRVRERGQERERVCVFERL